MRLKTYRTSILLGVTFTILLSAFWFLPQLAFIIFISLLLQLLLTPLVDVHAVRHGFPADHGETATGAPDSRQCLPDG